MKRCPAQDELNGNHVAFWIAATALGIALRITAIALAPRYGYLLDHDDMVRWGIQLNQQGLAALYETPAPRHHLQKWVDGGWTLGERHIDRVCNYPPLCPYLFSVSAQALSACRPDQLINTFASRACFSSWSLCFDVIFALGCAAIVGEFRPGRPARVTYLVALLAPPIWITSCLWGQVDTWMLAPAVWMIHAMLTARWIRAGVLFGLAAAIKPQAAAFLPVWGLVFLISPARWRALAGIAAAAATLFLIALPFTVAGGFDWWRQSYQENLLTHSRGQTTLMGFNIWYLDCLLTGSIDENNRLLGLTRDRWGQAGLLSALAVAVIVAWRQRARFGPALLVITGFSLLALVMLPTRVHERFLLLPIPFLICAGALWKSHRLGCALMLIAGTLQMSWPQWLAITPSGWAKFLNDSRAEYEGSLAALPPQERKGFPTYNEFITVKRVEYAQSRQLWLEWITTILALFGAAAVAVASCKPIPDEPPPRRRTKAESRSPDASPYR